MRFEIRRLWRKTPEPKKKLKVGLALGSGAAKGWAHIGVIHVLQKAGIPIDVVTGTSAGAVVGAFLSAQAMDKLEQFIEEYKGIRNTLSYLDFSIRSGGLIAGKRFLQFLEEHLPTRKFEDLPIPLGIVATDLVTMTEIHLHSGAVIPAIRASVSVPGFLSPYESQQMQLVDGGMMNPIPVSLARKLGADIVIGVDLGAYVEEEKATSVTGVMNRAIEVMMNRIRLENREKHPADIWIEPNLSWYGFMDFHKTQEAIKEGERVATESLPKIQMMIANAKGQK